MVSYKVLYAFKLFTVKLSRQACTQLINLQFSIYISVQSAFLSLIYLLFPLHQHSLCILLTRPCRLQKYLHINKFPQTILICTSQPLTRPTPLIFTIHCTSLASKGFNGYAVLSSVIAASRVPLITLCPAMLALLSNMIKFKALRSNIFSPSLHTCVLSISITVQLICYRKYAISLASRHNICSIVYKL